MATDDRGATVTLQELLVASLVTADAVTELLMEKGIITEREFTNKLRESGGNIKRWSKTSRTRPAG